MKQYIPKSLKDLYVKAVSGTTSISNNTFIETMETDYPELKTCKKKKESEVYLECLKTALKQINPKYDTNQGYIYFTPSMGGRIRTKEVYDWFEKLCEKYITDNYNETESNSSSCNY